MISIDRKEKIRVIFWSCFFSFIISQGLCFFIYLFLPSSWDLGKKSFLIIDLILTIILCLIVSTLIYIGFRFSSSIRINK
jgi:hypothetical protein